jgi:hypothetical protein
MNIFFQSAMQGFAEAYLLEVEPAQESRQYVTTRDRPVLEHKYANMVNKKEILNSLIRLRKLAVDYDVRAIGEQEFSSAVQRVFADLSFRIVMQIEVEDDAGRKVALIYPPPAQSQLPLIRINNRGAWEIIARHRMTGHCEYVSLDTVLVAATKACTT